MTRNLLVALACATLLTTACSDVKKVFRPNIWVGDSVPASRNKTVDNVDDWYKVSSLETKVPLYNWQIAELMAQGKPFLVVFGTPQHCTMCVDQIVRVAVMALPISGDSHSYPGRTTRVSLPSLEILANSTGSWGPSGCQSAPGCNDSSPC